MKNEHIWNDYIQSRKGIYGMIMPNQVSSNLISEANWMIRARCQSCEDLGMEVSPGDICYMDFGQAYLNEAGYQHFGLVVSICNKKALVVPMTSNAATYARAWDPKTNPQGKKHLMRLPEIRGLYKKSVLFLNDIKFINTARIIRITGHLSVRCATFHEIKERLRTLLQV